MYYSNALRKPDSVNTSMPHQAHVCTVCLYYCFLVFVNHQYVFGLCLLPSSGAIVLLFHHMWSLGADSESHHHCLKCNHYILETLVKPNALRIKDTQNTTRFDIVYWL